MLPYIFLLKMKRNQSMAL